MVGFDRGPPPEDVSWFEKDEITQGEITRVKPKYRDGSLVYQGPEATWELIRPAAEEVGLDTEGFTRELIVQIERILYPAFDGKGYLIVNEVIAASEITKETPPSTKKRHTSNRSPTSTGKKNTNYSSQKLDQHRVAKESMADPDKMSEMTSNKL